MRYYAFKHSTSFFNGMVFVKYINAIFLTLILKCKESSNIKDYWPILGLNTIYKLISKLLATRLSLVMLELISRNQVAFIKGRMLSDNNVLVGLHKLIFWFQSLKLPNEVLKQVCQIIYKFIWDSFQGIIWRWMVLPWGEGELGLWDPQNMERATSTRRAIQLWSFDSLWEEWM